MPGIFWAHSTRLYASCNQNHCRAKLHVLSFAREWRAFQLLRINVSLRALESRVNYFSRVAGERPWVALRGRVRRNSRVTKLVFTVLERNVLERLTFLAGTVVLPRNTRFVRFTKSVSVVRHATWSKVSIGQFLVGHESQPETSWLSVRWRVIATILNH